jgi:hypothetical protein
MSSISAGTIYKNPLFAESTSVTVAATFLDALDDLERRNLIGWPKLLLLREFLKLSFSLLHLTQLALLLLERSSERCF